MNEYKDSVYLPLGTIVLLKDGNKKIMIIGFTVIEENSEKMFDYLGCLYPEGVLSSSKNLLFNNSDIAEVVNVGYVDEEEYVFKNKLEAIVKKFNSIE